MHSPGLFSPINVLRNLSPTISEFDLGKYSHFQSPSLSSSRSNTRRWNFESAAVTSHFMDYQDWKFLLTLKEKCPGLVHFNPYEERNDTTEANVGVCESHLVSYIFNQALTLLMLYVEMKLEYRNVEPFSWTEFKAALKRLCLANRWSTLTPEFGILCRADVVIGAIDLTMDFQCVNSFQLPKQISSFDSWDHTVPKTISNSSIARWSYCISTWSSSQI